MADTDRDVPTEIPQINFKGRSIPFPAAFALPELVSDGFAANITTSVSDFDGTVERFLDHEVSRISEDLGGKSLSYRVLQSPVKFANATWVAALDGSYSYDRWEVAFTDLMILGPAAEGGRLSLFHITGTALTADTVALSRITDVLSRVAVGKRIVIADLSQ